MEKIAEKSCIGFVDVLASKAPVPGGGGAAALVGAIGMALGSMVCNLTTGKKKYAQYEDDLHAIWGKATTLHAQLNLIINLWLMKDKEYAKALDEKCEALVKEGVEICDVVYNKVIAAMR